jgi:hypothetical protein
LSSLYLNIPFLEYSSIKKTGLVDVKKQHLRRLTRASS